MKGGTFFKSRPSELRDEPGSGSLFGSVKILINERARASISTIPAARFLLMGRCDAENICKATISCASNGILMS
jgi:hypothetical protein